MVMNNIILLATYWNEIDLVEASLAQIDSINPMEIIICDGCFDDRYPLYSTDGTREIIAKYVSERDNAVLISPKRYSKVRGAWQLYKGYKKIGKINRLKASRIRTVGTAIKSASYRINQAVSFNYMIGISKYWKVGRWFMTYDCDVFYSDAMLEMFSVVNNETDLGLLTGSELTFFTDFNSYTMDYEKRSYNNMPHRIYSNTIIVPTRGLVIEGIISRPLYINKVKALHVGSYFHYKLNSRDRYSAAYGVGDRKEPDLGRYSFSTFDGQHPSVIQEYYGEVIRQEAS